ncbi:MAG: hypothetical protein ACLQDY_09710 [Streptosporangiaceae bacterium]
MASELSGVCLRLVKRLKDEELPTLLARERVLLTLLPEQLAPWEVVERRDGGLERGRLLAAVFDKVTADNHAEIKLLQARDLLGLSKSDPGFQERLKRLKAAGPCVPRQPVKLPDPSNIETRLALAAQRAGSSERTVRRDAGAILRALLTAVDEFRHHEDAVQALAAEFKERRGTSGLDDPLNAPEVRRVLRLCAQFTGELDQAFDTVSGPASFSTGLYVIRSLQNDLLGRLADPAKSAKAMAVVGEAGYGKTSLLWGLHRDLTGRAPFHPLLVNAAWLRAPGPASTPLLSGEDLVSTVTALDSRATTPVILLDTMDLLMHQEDESVRVIDLIDELRSAGARTVVTCREQEATALDRHFETVRLGTYDEAELPGAIERHVLAFCPDAPPRPIEEKVGVMLRLASRGLGVTEVCHHPLFLRLLFEAYEGIFPSEEVDARGVLAAYFDQKICDDVRGRTNPDVARDDVHAECFCLAIAMFSAGAVALPRDDLLSRARRVAAAWDGTLHDTLAHALDLLIRRSVLLADSPDGIRFRHQLLFEYVAARALIARGGAAELRRLLGIVEERPLDLFTGAVFEQAMIYAWSASRTLRPHLAATLAALAESPSVNLQSVALVVAAYHPDIEAGVAELLQRAGPETVRRFVELTPRVSGRAVGRALMLLRRVWERGDPVCRRAVLNVLERFAVQHGQAIKDFIVDQECVQHVVEAKGDLLLSERALPRTLGLLAETDPKWSTEALLALFEAGGATTNNRALAVAILDIVADRWAYLGSARTLARFTLAVGRAQRRNGGREADAVRRAGGRLFAAYWTDLYRLDGPQPLAWEWLTLVAALRRKLAASQRAPLRVQLRLMGTAQALTVLSDGNPLIEPTLTRLFPPVHDSYGLPLLELSASFLLPLLRSASPAGDRTRALIRAALAGLPADPARTDDPASLRVSVARIAVTSAELPVGELASLLNGLPSLRKPEQWIDPGGAIALVVPAALGGHPVALAALDKIAAESASVGPPGRGNVTYALTRSIGEHPELIPQALAICAGWQIAAPFTEAIRRHGETLALHLAGYRAELDALVRDLFALGGEAQQDAMNLWLELDALDLVPPRSFDELRSAWLAANVLTAKQNILRLMGTQAGRGLLQLDKVTGLMRSLVIVEPSGLRAASGRFTDRGTLKAARDALVTALAQAGPLTEETLNDLLSLTMDRMAKSDTQMRLRLPMLRLAESGRADEAFNFYARIGELTADRGTTYQNKLANKLHGALLTVCENATYADSSRWIRALPALPVPFAQILVRALVRVAFCTVRDPLQQLAAEDGVPGPIALTIKNQLARHGRLGSSVVMDDLLICPNG